MACQALGRCRICARKHKIAVFGGEKSQHFFIEKADLKLIILNTVCIVCIEKFERFVKNMDLNMSFSNIIKNEDTCGTKLNDKVSDSGDIVTEKVTNNSMKMIRSSETSLKVNISTKATSMDVEHTAQPVQKSIENQASIGTRNKCTINAITDVSVVTHARSKSLRDSQSGIETSSEPEPKRFRNNVYEDESEISVEEKQTERKVQGSLSDLSSGSTIAFVDCGPSDFSSSVKKGGRSLCCDFCKKEFTHAGDLNKHRRKHTGEKPYECNQCKRKFAHASNLARHQRVHSGERPFACPRCARTFTRRDKLTIHVAAGRCEIISTDTNMPQALKVQTIVI